MDSPVTSPEKSRGVRFIATYKAAKAVIQLVLVCLLAVGLNDHRFSSLQERLIEWHAHLTATWSNKLAVWFETNLTRPHLRVAVVALGADFLLTATESWALYKDKAWGEWLVVVATSGLIPFEIYEIFQRPRVARFVVLLINAVVVAFLVSRQLMQHRTSNQAALAEASKHADSLPPVDDRMHHVPQSQD
ncbi:MAG: DUF2127 domain-containing protein [Clostridia bacterium]|nr:DUF2127 domain-containing protein [Deltaproteobacteria bacterium]